MRHSGYRPRRSSTEQHFTVQRDEREHDPLLQLYGYAAALAVELFVDESVPFVHQGIERSSDVRGGAVVLHVSSGWVVEFVHDSGEGIGV